MKEIERVRDYLKNRDPSLRIIELDSDTSTAYLAAQALGTEVGQIAKSILFKSKTGDYFMVVSAGDVKINNRAIKELAGSRVKMASAEEVNEITGFNIGGVCPFAMETEVPVYLDESLQRYDVVYAAAGSSNTALPITYAQLVQITGGSLVNVGVNPHQDEEK
ncbi:MAG: YbaK/EbsC family protein [Syntrophomonadaceae bacterium]|nr:YbaK/EbsC family protein [Syntrophomonadaceae bacterium]MDD3889797.1 YbaK/EbsC family protein [Syntrophomonadaceae bacterium]MDD4549354.1 YbaK/EbsC family protein [Syntrophomonadaceae bacterium]